MDKLTRRMHQSSLMLMLLILILAMPSYSQMAKEGNQNAGMQPEEPKLLYQTGNPEDWPKEQDAVVSAPNHHKILLENDKVRVLEVSLAPKAIEPLHHHQWPSVLYIMEAGDFIDRDGAGNIIFDTRKLPEPLVFPLTMWKGPEAPHSVENLSAEKTIRLIRVEIKP